MDRFPRPPGKETLQTLLHPACPYSSPLFYFFGELRSKPGRQGEGGFENERRHRIELVGFGGQPEPHRLEGDRPAAGGRVEHGRCLGPPTIGQQTPQSLDLFGVGADGEGPRAFISLFELDPFHFCCQYSLVRRHRVTRYTEQADEPLSIVLLLGEESVQIVGPAIRPGRQHRPQDSSARRDQGPPRPPDMKEVKGRQRRGGASFPLAFHTDYPDREPVFDQSPWAGHRSLTRSRKARWARRPRRVSVALANQ